MGIGTRKLAASIVVAALLASVGLATLPHGGTRLASGIAARGITSPDSHCRNTQRRCAGLWSAACCDFYAPGRRTEEVPGGFNAHAAAGAMLAAPNAAPLAAGIVACAAAELLLDERAGPLPPPLLTSQLLI